MRIAHISDLHLDDHRRPGDTERVLGAFLVGAREAEADLIVCTGDLTADQTRASTEGERERVRKFVTEAAEIAPVEIIRGNHDVTPDAGLFNGLRTKHPLRYHVRPNFPAPGVADLCVKTRAGLVGILAIPWFSRAGIAAKAPAGASISEITHYVNQAARGLLQGAALAAEEIKAAGAVPIVLFHGDVSGAKYSSGFTPLGETVAFTVEELREVGAAYVALGHYHLAQEWDGGRIAYAGSIERRNFGEPEEKGWRLVEIDGERFSNTFMPLPAREIVLLERDWSSTEDFTPDVRAVFVGDADDAAQVEGALVRFRYQIRPEDAHLVDRDAIRRALLDAGAREVRIEPVVEVQARVRCEEIVGATGLHEELIAWAGAKGIEVGEEQVERLRLCCAEMESPKGQEVNHETA